MLWVSGPSAGPISSWRARCERLRVRPLAVGRCRCCQALLPLLESGGRQAWIPEPNGEIVTSPYTLRALLGKLDGLNVAARTRDRECGCG
jgi:hypothetical protein